MNISIIFIAFLYFSPVFPVVMVSVGSFRFVLSLCTYKACLFDVAMYRQSASHILYLHIHIIISVCHRRRFVPSFTSVLHHSRFPCMEWLHSFPYKSSHLLFFIHLPHRLSSLTQQQPTTLLLPPAHTVRYGNEVIFKWIFMIMLAINEWKISIFTIITLIKMKNVKIQKSFWCVIDTQTYCGSGWMECRQLFKFKNRY